MLAAFTILLWQTSALEDVDVTEDTNSNNVKQYWKDCGLTHAECSRIVLDNIHKTQRGVAE